MKVFFRILTVVTFVNIIIWSGGCSSNNSANNNTNRVLQNETKIDSLMGLMTLEEKVHMLHATSSFTSGGVKRLGIPELVMSDGPHGVRIEHGRDWNVDNITTDSATYLPTGITLASTWNKELGYKKKHIIDDLKKTLSTFIELGIIITNSELMLRYRLP